MNKRTISRKKKWRECVEALYNLIDSKKEKTIFTDKEIISYVTKNVKILPRNSSTVFHLGSLIRRQMKYYVFKRVVCEGGGNNTSIYQYIEYIFVRRTNESIARQIKGYRDRC